MLADINYHEHTIRMRKVNREARMVTGRECVDAEGWPLPRLQRMSY
jgi:hypothetical protein